MLKKLVFLSVYSLSQPLFAAHEVALHNAPLSSLDKFIIIENQPEKNAKLLHSSKEKNTLELINITPANNQTVSRYQQKYKGIPVSGSEIIIVKSNNAKKGMLGTQQTQVNGTLMADIQMDIKPGIEANAALSLAKDAWLGTHTDYQVQEETTQLALRQEQGNDLTLVYLVSFKGVKAKTIPALPSFVIDANTGKILHQWNNMKHFDDKGPGGNEKVKQYWYGEDGLPMLNVTQDKNENCLMINKHVKLVDLKSRWDEKIKYKKTYQYTCGQNIGDPVNGAYSPNNDAYYFGNIIVDMYQNWYNIHALQTPKGKPMQLVMRTHFGENFDNAFWYKDTMNFGDGKSLYPLVTMDIAGHEVSHGFTEQHSNLEYHDQSGSLNESFSDMAGIAVRAYALENDRALYNRSHLVPDVITWAMAESVMRDPKMKAMRYMDQPSKDGHSADCVSRTLAISNGQICNITYQDVVNFARRYMQNEDDIQSYIVHTGSGVFNKAFYLMSQEMGIKEAFQIMIEANVTSWTSKTEFDKAACAVLGIAKTRNHSVDMMHGVFGKVGIETTACPL